MEDRLASSLPNRRAPLVGHWPVMQVYARLCAWINLCMRPANERRRCIAMSSLIGRTHAQNNPWCRICHNSMWLGYNVIDRFSSINMMPIKLQPFNQLAIWSKCSKIWISARDGLSLAMCSCQQFAINKFDIYKSFTCPYYLITLFTETSHNSSDNWHPELSQSQVPNACGFLAPKKLNSTGSISHG